MERMPSGLETNGNAGGKQPNIVVILSDDQGPWTLGCAGNHEIRTPNLDRLAAEGTRFDHFFCASPVCSPARATLLTGEISSQHGVHDWIEGGNIRTETQDPIQYLAGKTSYTQVLAANGYTCGLSGKWHLGDSIVPQHGFSHWYVHQRGGGPYYNAPMIRDGELIEQPGYLTDAITDDALAFIDERHGHENPFYLGVHYTAPHSPWIDSHPQDIVDSYDDCPFDSIPRDPEHPWALPGWVPTPGSTKWLETWYLDFVRPAVDGVREPVTGTGQIERAGPANRGRLAFLQGQRLDKEVQQRELMRDSAPSV